MKDKSLKQIQPGSALNNINVPQQFQTGTYYPPGVQTPPPAIGQMGTMPMQQPNYQKTPEYKEFQRDSSKFVGGLNKGFIHPDIKEKYPITNQPTDQQLQGSMDFFEQVKEGYKGKKTINE